MNTARTAAAALAILVTVTATAVAGPLRPDRVGASAEWIVHVDVEALHRSTIGRFILEHADDLGIDMSELDAMRKDIGMDPRTDVMSVTAYGPTGPHRDDGVIVAVTSANADEALVRAMATPEVAAELHDVGGYPVHALTSEGETMYVHLRPDGGRRLVVAGDDRDAVLRALHVIDGRAESAKTNAIVARPPRSGSIVFAAARDAEMLEAFEPAADLARLSDTVAIDLGENEGALFAIAAIATGSEQDARDAAQVVQGLIALGRLMAGEEPDLAPLRDLANAMHVTADGAHLQMRFEHDAGPVIEALKEAFEETEHEPE